MLHLCVISSIYLRYYAPHMYMYINPGHAINVYRVLAVTRAAAKPNIWLHCTCGNNRCFYLWFYFFSTLFILSPHSSHPRAKMADRSSCSTSPLCVGLALLFLTVVTMRYWTVSVEKDDLQNDLGQVKFQLLKEWVCAILRERERERESTRGQVEGLLSFYCFVPGSRRIF